MAVNSSSLGTAPASDSSLALTITMNRIRFSPAGWVIRAGRPVWTGCILTLSMHRTRQGEIDTSSVPDRSCFSAWSSRRLPGGGRSTMVGWRTRLGTRYPERQSYLEIISMNRVLARMSSRDIYLAAGIAGMLTVAHWTGLFG